MSEQRQQLYCTLCDLEHQLYEDAQGFHHVIKGERVSCANDSRNKFDRALGDNLRAAKTAALKVADERAKEAVELRAQLAKLIAAAETVCGWDWSSNNDDDAVRDVYALQKIVAALTDKRDIIDAAKEMPSSLNDACRTIEMLCDEVARLRARLASARKALEEIKRVGGQDLCRGIAAEAVASLTDEQGK